MQEGTSATIFWVIFLKYLFRKSRKELEKIKPWVFIRSLKSNIFGKFAGKINTDFFKLQIVCPKKMGCYTLQKRKTKYWGLTTFWEFKKKLIHTSINLTITDLRNYTQWIWNIKKHQKFTPSGCKDIGNRKSENSI